jgi:hypothetical protein
MIHKSTDEVFTVTTKDVHGQSIEVTMHTHGDFSFIFAIDDGKRMDTIAIDGAVLEAMITLYNGRSLE